MVIGPELPLDDLPGIAVELATDGERVAAATGAAAGGHPAAGVAWLAAQLDARVLALEPGDLMITGGLTAAVPLAPGGRSAAVFSWAGVDQVTVDVTR